LLGPSHHVVVVPANQASVEVNERGGAIKLVEEGWFQQKLADSAYATFKKIDSGEKISVGVNRYVDGVSNA
jgi:methylmalonyl-CoA mutase N-terminal domain/subunit